jgi:hypothetical protein
VAKTSFISKRRRRDHPIVRNAGYGVSRISPDAIGQDLIKLAPIELAGATGLEPVTCGFGDRRSTN